MTGSLPRLREPVQTAAAMCIQGGVCAATCTPRRSPSASATAASMAASRAAASSCVFFQSSQLQHAGQPASTVLSVKWQATGTAEEAGVAERGGGRQRRPSPGPLHRQRC